MLIERRDRDNDERLKILTLFINGGLATIYQFSRLFGTSSSL